MRRSVVSVAVVFLSGAVGAFAADMSVPKTHGWRGNWTGLYPDADAPTEWGRTSTGIARTLRISAERPKGADAGDAKLMVNHWPKEWLIIGPFEGPAGSARASERFAQAFLGDETQVQPAAGDQVGKLAWKRFEIPEPAMPPYERGSVAGMVSLERLNFNKELEGVKEAKDKAVCYAATNLYAERDGEVVLIIDHAYGVKVLVNGEEVYRDEEEKTGLGHYVLLGRNRTRSLCPISPRVGFKLKKGWNRLLVKMTPGKWRNEQFFWFNARIIDPPGTAYVDRNIVWTAPLYDRSIATPIVVGDRIFVMAEPDQILCLDKATGRQLWTNFVNRYHATPKAERDATPAFAQTVAPLVAKLPEMKTLPERMALRKEIDAALVAIDKEKYTLVWDDHMQGHFRVVGWTMPTPVSDGKHVWVWCGNGIAACYDLAGNTRWIRRVSPGKMHYPASPALIDGKFIVYAGGGFNMVALDAATGAEVWRQPKVDRTQASLIPARINGVNVVISQDADIVRASDGKLLWERPDAGKRGTGWAAPVCLGNVVYQPIHGVHLLILDFSEGKTEGDAWAPRQTSLSGSVNSKNSKGKWVDRPSPGSPLIHEGIYYNIDVFGSLCAIDMKTGKLLYREELSHTFNSLRHYNAVGVAASVTLGGKYLYVMDNQGTCVVFKPGPKFEKVAVNRIGTQAERLWPMRPQEEIGYSPPTFEGTRMYLRGEHYLYCIGR